MCHEKLFRLALIVNVVLWVASLTVSVLHVYPDVVVPWYWQILREPVTVGLDAAWTVVLAVWHWAAPGGTAFRVGVQIGRAEGVVASTPNVLPIQGQRRSSLS